jgi:endonuclease III
LDALVKMGFAREAAVSALRRAVGNQPRALEILIKESQEAFRYSAGFNRLIATLISFNCGDQVVELFAALLREERKNDNSQHLYLFPSTLQCLRNLLKDAKTTPTVAEDAEYLETQLSAQRFRRL